MTSRTVNNRIVVEAGLSLALFVMALVPRLVGLQTFVTADEAKWVYRSAQFWLALLHGDWANTASKLKPAVTTMWSAGSGFWVYNRFHENLPFADFLAAVPEWQVNPAVLHATRMPTILLSCGMVVFVFLLLRPVLGRWPAFLAGFFLAFDPLFLAHSRFLHHDALVTLFALPSLLPLPTIVKFSMVPLPKSLSVIVSHTLAPLASSTTGVRGRIIIVLDVSNKNITITKNNFIADFPLFILITIEFNCS